MEFEKQPHDVGEAFGLPIPMKAGRREDPHQAPVEIVPIDALVADGSPRSRGESPEHAHMLASSGAQLPPILVHRQTMRVIDGFHRLSAARIRGRDTIEARFFDGSASQAFVLAVQTNVTHGLPLSLSDREAAAARMITDFPAWSNRAVAAATGLAAGTVSAVRQRTDSVKRPPVRLGRDGRLRPVNSEEGRRKASEIIQEYPDASLREIARRAGISPATVRDVRARMTRGDDPIAVRRSAKGVHRHGQNRDAPPSVPPPPRVVDHGREDIQLFLGRLHSDPALRFTDGGKELLRWATSVTAPLPDWENMTALVPPHSSYPLARLARRCADEWLRFADHLEQNVQKMA
ncbi:winged helix-turn-helix transcriptional regulator [Actinoplanes sp. NPDC049548]|uniref:ParB and winged helix-turn-helix domain-containing protein n=1 Tax=Actinoplanes sp. NPDC049548 TaxID=3155152 RepID=UPI003434DA56